MIAAVSGASPVFTDAFGFKLTDGSGLQSANEGDPSFSQLWACAWPLSPLHAMAAAYPGNLLACMLPCAGHVTVSVFDNLKATAGSTRLSENARVRFVLAATDSAVVSRQAPPCGLLRFGHSPAWVVCFVHRFVCCVLRFVLFASRTFICVVIDLARLSLLG